jgi:multiple sugar transport system permease protein
MQNPATIQAGGKPCKAPINRRAPVVLAQFVVWLGVLFCIFPPLWSAVSSFRPAQSFLVSPFDFSPGQFTLANYRQVWEQGNFPGGFASSAIQVGIVLSCTLFFCPLAGYAFAKFRFRFQGFFFGLVLLTLFVVPIATFIPLLLEMNAIGWVDTYKALALPLAISPLGIFWMRGAIAAIPDELLQAAHIDGCGHFETWWRIVMPVIQPALVSLAVITFLGAYNDYFWPLVITRTIQTIQIALALLLNPSTITSIPTANFGPQLAGSTVVILPTILIFLFLQRYFLSGVLEGSLKS